MANLLNTHYVSPLSLPYAYVNVNTRMTDITVYRDGRLYFLAAYRVVLWLVTRCGGVFR